MCKAGAGIEKTPGTGDTPGFPLSKRPKISVDHKGSRKLSLDRNHSRVVQTSDDLLQAWRGNCDVQILIYSSDPDKPDASEIAQVTDYVVAYSCKGNKTLKEEREQTKNLLMRSKEETCDKKDVQRVIKQVLNTTVSNRIISKQECCVLLANLNLFYCSETIQSVSLSGGKRLSATPAEANSAPKSFLKQYEARPSQQENLSLHQYFLAEKGLTKGGRTVVPHYVGMSGQPVYPVTVAYAKSVCLIHKPWRKIDLDREWIKEFDLFLYSVDCPESVRIAYKRVFYRYIRKLTHVETLAKEHPGDSPIDEDDENLMDLCRLSRMDSSDIDDHNIMSFFNKGLNVDWSLETTKVNNLSCIVLDLFLMYISSIFINIESVNRSIYPSRRVVDKDH